MTSASLGLGTYRIHSLALSDAVIRAAADPTSAWIDTAPNYLNGQAQSLLAPALAQHRIPDSTKIGFLTDRAARDAVLDGTLTTGAAERGHCLSSPYVHWQCSRNRTELGRDHLDLVFAHNSEQTDGDPYEALRDAFTALEAEAAAGALSTYGVATWDGFDTGTLNVPALHRLATEVAGTEHHHLRAIQLPVSLVTATAFTRPWTKEARSPRPPTSDGRSTPQHPCSAGNFPTWPPPNSPHSSTPASPSPRHASSPRPPAQE
ncbi:aldo/keto reductase [Streptomyces sp. AC495_CC817]|uniref:aldo/keto reductase n=1 Tax=Streptomyces sp. AC495_CC817 TaxID=2823900 RepID=UPI001C280090|nr:aldo/keto reductase [Streptomyces sp. AC495_CC817]